LGHSFNGWFFFYSPFGRMSEFLLGATAAQVYLASGPRGIFSGKPEISTSALAIAITAWVVGTSIWQTPLAGVMGSAIAAPIACFVLLCALYRTKVSRLLSTPALVKGGEASYSLYLLHWCVMHEGAAKLAAGFGTFVRLAIYLAGIGVSLLVARCTYLWFERPALRWLRAHFRPLRLPVVFGALFVVTTLFCLIMSLHVHAVGDIRH
jgi:peptidoglycan/LPS O-acetylase OafA/YrhL